MVYTEPVLRWQQFHIAPVMQQRNSAVSNYFSGFFFFKCAVKGDLSDPPHELSESAVRAESSYINVISNNNRIIINSLLMIFCLSVPVPASQLSQSAYYSLQLPFEVFGLGQTPNFVDLLEVGIQNPRNTVSSLLFLYINICMCLA